MRSKTERGCCSGREKMSEMEAKREAGNPEARRVKLVVEDESGNQREETFEIMVKGGVPVLVCPICGALLLKGAFTKKCANGHAAYTLDYEGQHGKVLDAAFGVKA
jgi:hypothetical protein